MEPILRVVILVMLTGLLLGLSVTGSTDDAGATPTGSWELVTEHAQFSPRDTSEDAILDGKMWISNAYHNGNVLVRDMWRTSDGVTWEQVSDATPYDGYSEMTVYDGKLWAVKGSVWCSEDGENWTQVLEKTPFGARGYGELVVKDGKMWQLGSGRDVWWTTNGKDWTCATDDAPFGNRHACAVTVYKGMFWVMGGSSPGTNDPPEKGYKTMITHNDVWYSADGANWQRVLDHAPWTPRMWFVSQVYAGKMWVIGGYDNRNSQNLAETWYTEDGLNWHEFKSENGQMWSARHEPTPYVFDGSLWVVAGNSWPLMNDVWRLTLPAEG